MAWHSGKPADSDFLSASVQHIRENFAELEPLQPHVAELVDLTTLHPNVAELVDLTALQPHIAALLNSRIVEMGSNSNGHYVRWESGLQVCYHRLIIGNPDGVQSFSWTYPAAFASSGDAYPMGIVAASGPGPGVFSQYVKSAVMRSTEALATETTFFVEFSNAPSTGIHIHAFAIGRWK